MFNKLHLCAGGTGMEDLGELLKKSAANHGHLCPGQVLGVRLAMLGCRKVGIYDPKSSRDLIVYVEIDRCATDAIQSVTGCKLGKRTLKFMDYGKMAATFYNLRENKAVRVLARDDSRERAKEYGSATASAKESQTQAYMEMDDADLFVVTLVRSKLRQDDLPSHPLSRVDCDQYGDGINGKREVVVDGRTLCKACANGAYYMTAELCAPPDVVLSTNPTTDTNFTQDQSVVTPTPVVAVIGFSNSGKT
jgi:formylmethanofuran dehydrogenase subunit E